MRIINITRDSVAIVDDDDFDFINSYNWSMTPRENTAYAVRKGRRNAKEPRTIQMHRQIMGFPEGVQIDHINGNGLDNRKNNLRTSSVQTNAFNRVKPNITSTSKFKGVLQRKGRKVWEARVKYNEKAIHLGIFATEEEGASAYNYGATLMYGEYARLNNGVAELPPEIKTIIYKRCLNQVIKRNWHPKTGVFFVANNSGFKVISNV